MNNHQKRNLTFLTLPQLLSLLRLNFEGNSKKLVTNTLIEIENHYANSKLTYKQQAQENCLLLLKNQLNGYKSLYDIVENEKSIDSAIFFEQWASQGHPIHPCSKTKLGFNLEETNAYAPEFHPIVKTYIAAIHVKLARTVMENENDNYMSWFKRQFVIDLHSWKTALLQRNLSPSDFVPLFIHPWQAKHKIPELFQPLIEKKQLIIMEEAIKPLHPSLSFRTLYPEDPAQPMIKLPVAIQATSALRTVSPNAIENGPKISRAIRQIMKNDTKVNATLRVLYDSVGIRLNCNDSSITKHCSTLFRDNVHTVIGIKEIPIVTAALFRVSPISQKPFLVEILEHSEESDVINYFQYFIKTLIPPYLVLYHRYGIAMEAHQQNMLLVFKNKLMVASIIRDFGGLSIYKPTFDKYGFIIQPYPNSPIFTDCQMDARNVLIHTLFQSCIGELIIMLASHYQLPESGFWQEVHAQTLAVMDELAEGQHNSTYWQKEKQAFFEEDWPLKSLLTMRLKDQSSDYIFNTTKNPFQR